LPCAEETELSSVNESEDNCVPRVEVSGTVVSPCGNAALGSVVVTVVIFFFNILCLD